MTNGALPELTDELTVTAGQRTLDHPSAARRGWALTAPLNHRILRGEGGLLIVNWSLAFTSNPALEATVLAVASLLCLCGLYLFNDLVDAREDLENPKKDHRLAELYVRERSLFLLLWFAITTLAIALAGLIRATSAIAMVTVVAVNVAYSLRFKRLPVVDIVWVGLWGCAFGAIVSDSPAWLAMIGAMTAACHIYQASEDREVDRRHGLRTSATLPWAVLSAIQVALSLILAGAAWHIVGDRIALTLLAFPFYWFFWRRSVRIAWIVAKVHFTIVWAWLIWQGGTIG